MNQHFELPSCETSESFIRLMAAEQLRLHHYIAMLVGDPHVAEDVLQETNVVLWRKAAEFRQESNFSAWARKIAYWQVRAYLRDRGRERMVFSEEVMEQIADLDYEELVDSDSLDALRQCLREVTSLNRKLLERKYSDNWPISAIASEVNKTEEAVRAALMRIRRSLRRCIDDRSSGP
jgi:RNA polymerase sigma-70 factor (ECF subfamily)